MMPARRASSFGGDNLTYNYYANTNRLSYIADTVPAGNFTTDIDNQSQGNYTYDANGSMWRRLPWGRRRSQQHMQKDIGFIVNDINPAKKLRDAGKRATCR
jgi:hypothetical protein